MRFTHTQASYGSATAPAPNKATGPFRSVKRGAVLRSVAFLAAMAVGAPLLVGSANSAPVRSAPIELLAADTDVSPRAIPVSSRSSRAAERLRKAFRPHFPAIYFTREMKALLGDPNITVLDYRGGSDRTSYVCSFLNRSGERVVVCD
ncbi:MAG: hypothetical protein AAGM04_04120 [Pseudomonadota bacterium]